MNAATCLFTCPPPAAPCALQFISSCWPFPADEKICVQLVEEALTSAPQLFRDDAR
jgi:hypothetical protein